MSFGKNLRRLRLKAKLSQTALAKMAGVGQKSLSNWERDEYDPGWSDVIRLADALGVSLDDLRTKKIGRATSDGA